MTRTPEVIDVWFDSGAMPFAQSQIPLDSEKPVPPADLIIEAIDQTRGWFFSLLAVSVLHTGSAPYKAVLSTGHVLDEKGQKMSKSQGNVIDPYDILNTHGADALRWSLLAGSSPWSNKRYAVSMAAEARSRMIDTLLNVLSFYQLYAEIDGYRPTHDLGQEQGYAASLQTTLAYPLPSPEHPLLPLDRWLLSRLHHTAAEVQDALDQLDVLQAAKRLELLVDDLSNWYVRRSRQRFWSSGLTADKRSAFRLLHHALQMCSRMLAPFLPFLSEHIHQQLGGAGSVHLCDYPQAQAVWIDVAAEMAMQDVRRAVELGRRLRERHQLRNRQPLAVLYLVSPDTTSWQPYLDLIREELNVKSVQVVEDDQAFTEITFKLDLRTAGSRYGALIPQIRQHLASLRPEQARQYMSQGAVPWKEGPLPDGQIPLTDLLVERTARPGYAFAADAGVQVALDIAPTKQLLAEGQVREVIRLIQDYRKQLDLPLEQRIALTIDADDSLTAILQQHRPLLAQHVLLASLHFGSVDGMHRCEQSGICIGLAIDNQNSQDTPTQTS